MNTQATQHPPSAIELLAEAMSYAHGDNKQDITDAITSIWLSVFRTEQNLAMALEAIKISHDSANARDMCQHYLVVMKGVK
jgi:hypothetical protein